MTKSKAVKMVRGEAALALAVKGAKLYVFNAQNGWVEGDVNTLARALRMDPHATWIYGVRA